MIHVIAKIKTKAGRRVDFLTEFKKVVPPVLNEAGCVEYGPTRDARTNIAAQQLAGDEVTVIIERWESLAALEAHLETDHMKEFRERVADLVESSVLEIYETA